MPLVEVFWSLITIAGVTLTWLIVRQYKKTQALKLADGGALNLGMPTPTLIVTPPVAAPIVAPKVVPQVAVAPVAATPIVPVNNVAPIVPSGV